MRKPQNYDHLLGISGMSDALLKNHFALYQGYVNNINKLSEILENLIKEEKSNSVEYAEMKRRFGWEWNGMRLHELYFGNMAKENKELNNDSSLLAKVNENFESFENWEKDFRSAAAIRGIGWVILYYDKESDGVFNIWVNEHDVGHLAGCAPLLVLDVFEHAYVLDYGIKRADYIEAFMKAIDWKAVEERFNSANTRI